MSQEIVIRITIPDGVGIVTPEVTQGQFVPPFADELIPLPPEAIPVQGDPTAFRGMASAQTVAQAPTLAQQTSGCAIHLKPWNLVPAGVSKKTGQPYDAFLACPERGCKQRP